MFTLWKRILRLALPSIASFSSMTLTGMITLIIIGRLGAFPLAVVGIANIFMYNMWALFAGIGESVNYLISQNLGENTMQEGNERLQISLVMSAIMMVFVGLASIYLPYHIFIWLGTSHALAAFGQTYLRVRLIAFMFSLFTNVFAAYMRGVGDTKTPMYISLITNGLLAVLTFGLAYGQLGLPRMGLLGAGISVIITEGIGFFLSGYIYFFAYHKRFQTLQWVKMHRAQWNLMIRESIKLSAMELSMSFGMLVFTASITWLGATAVAANEIVLNILSFGYMPANGFGAAATIALGQEVGARHPMEARRVGLHTVWLGLILMAVFSLVLVLWGEPIAKIYSPDPHIYNLTALLIHIVAYIELFDGAGLILAGALRGVGDTTFLFRMSLLLNWVLFIPLTLFLTKIMHMGQVGAWVALCTLIVLIAVTNGWRYLSLRWESLITVSARMLN